MRLIQRTILLALLACTPVFALAQWGEVRGKAPSAQSSSADNWWKDRFSLGITFSADFYKYSGGFGGGLLFNIGRFTDLLNVSVGAEYIEYIVSDPRPEDTRSTLNLVDGGGQLVVPVTAKLLLLRTSEWSKVYVGCGAEWGFRMHEGGVTESYYPDKHALRKTSMAVVPMLGCRSQHLDFGIYYKHYVDKPFFPSLDGSKDLGETDKRFGCYLTWLF